MACADYLVHPFRKRYFEERYTKEKKEANVKRESEILLGRDVVVQYEGAPSLVCEVLEIVTACEKALSTSLTHTSWGRLC